MKTYKVMCWDSVDNRLNVFGLTAEEAEKKLAELEKRYPNCTFQIFEDEDETIS